MTYLLPTDPLRHGPSPLFLSLSPSVSFIHLILSFIFHSSSRFVSAAASPFQSSPLQQRNIKMRFDESVIRLPVFCPLSPFWRRLLVLQAEKCARVNVSTCTWLCLWAGIKYRLSPLLFPNRHISSLIFRLASKRILKFCSDSDLLWGRGSEEEDEVRKSQREKGGWGETALPPLYSHHFGWVNEKFGPRQVQHEKVMGSVCRQNAIGPIHALQAKVAALTHGKVNIRVQLKENQCTLSFFIKCLYLHHKWENIPTSCKGRWLPLISFNFIWQLHKWKLSHHYFTPSQFSQHDVSFFSCCTNTPILDLQLPSPTEIDSRGQQGSRKSQAVEIKRHIGGKNSARGSNWS